MSRDDKSTYAERVAKLLLSARTTVHGATGKSPDELFLGRKMRTKFTTPVLQTEDKVAVTQKEEDQRITQGWRDSGSRKTDSLQDQRKILEEG